jgi:NhaP-type Na+/H+ or K+/H+ antiporter
MLLVLLGGKAGALCAHGQLLQPQRALSTAASAATPDAHFNATPHAAEVLHPHTAVLFPFMVMGMGVVTSFALARWAPAVPYTVMLMVEGIAIGGIDVYANTHGSLAHSLHMWEGMDPHLLLFAFLPALLFGDAMCMDTHVESKCFWQCLTLAGPGVLLGAGLTALVAKFMFPYGWGWMISLTFGSILAATDPVAVVSLLKALGASPKLTILIAGESLLNDGTAIVLFVIFRNYAASVTYTPLGVLGFVTRMAVGGPAVGFAAGYIMLFCLRRVRRRDGGEGPTKQAVITLVGAYLTFFVAESELGSSGVLATVCAAQVIAHSGWPIVLDHENMEAVWKTVEFAGNTVIFVLAGTVLGNVCITHWVEDSDVLGWSDTGYLVLLWLVSNATRLLMLLLVAPALRRMGDGVSPKELLVMGWGGLRGAVGLALALSLRHSPAVDRKLGAQIVFHVGGMAFLTLAVNGTTVAPLLKYLGMTTPSASSERLFELMEHHVKGRMREEYVKRTMAALADASGGPVTSADDAAKRNSSVATYAEHSRAAVEGAVSVLSVRSPDTRAGGRRLDPGGAVVNGRPQLEPLHGMLSKSERNIVKELGGEAIDFADMRSWSGKGITKSEQLLDMRRMFLRSVRAAYWEMVEENVLPKRSRAVRCLMTSIDFAMDGAGAGIADWEHLVGSCGGDLGPLKRKLRLAWTFVPKHTRVARALLTKLAELYQQEFYLCSCFIRAHHHAQTWLAESFGENGAFAFGDASHLVLACVKESYAQIALAKKALAQLDEVTRRSSASKQLAGELLATQRAVAERLCRKGLVGEAGKQRLLERVEQDEARLDRARNDQARLRARMATLASAPRARRESLRKPAAGKLVGQDTIRHASAKTRVQRGAAVAPEDTECAV